MIRVSMGESAVQIVLEWLMQWATDDNGDAYLAAGGFGHLYVYDDNLHIVTREFGEEYDAAGQPDGPPREAMNAIRDARAAELLRRARESAEALPVPEAPIPDDGPSVDHTGLPTAVTAAWSAMWCGMLGEGVQTTVQRITPREGERATRWIGRVRHELATCNYMEESEMLRIIHA